MTFLTIRGVTYIFVRDLLAGLRQLFFTMPGPRGQTTRPQKTATQNRKNQKKQQTQTQRKNSQESSNRHRAHFQTQNRLHGKISQDAQYTKHGLSLRCARCQTRTSRTIVKQGSYFVISPGRHISAGQISIQKQEGIAGFWLPS